MPRFWYSSAAMVTSPYAFKLLERDVKQYTITTYSTSCLYDLSIWYAITFMAYEFKFVQTMISGPKQDHNSIGLIFCIHKNKRSFDGPRGSMNWNNRGLTSYLTQCTGRWTELWCYELKFVFCRDIKTVVGIVNYVQQQYKQCSLQKLCTRIPRYAVYIKLVV